ncbi:hypothetical protein AN189_17750 [Loktanella sp. 3ANDIMAR09]|uniref:hypothetical protein n=1 Tax=Loktanella sp. 3ANDIMAR09 TaxID=1225657 RepID=UPI0006F90DD4|nr:hypothetical protein [Loktanella sp. 3ANDIMAR09]KQI67066.1 hypothetical protein AN189_17750 [Loktanella sp. 3ANDIMAR09]
MTTLTDLARVRALFQQRAVVALLTEQPKGQTMTDERTYTRADLEAVAQAALEAAAALVPVVDDLRHLTYSAANNILSERRCAIRALSTADIVDAHTGGKDDD